jgi:hypothetical protein
MPYRSNQELPHSVKNSLPQHAQDIYREAFDNGWEEYADPSRLRRVPRGGGAQGGMGGGEEGLREGGRRMAAEVVDAPFSQGSGPLRLGGGFAKRRGRQMGSLAWWQTVTNYRPEPWREARNALLAAWAARKARAEAESDQGAKGAQARDPASNQ